MRVEAGSVVGGDGVLGLEDVLGGGVCIEFGIWYHMVPGVEFENVICWG